MAGRIKGITVEIGGDTTKLEQSLKAVNSTIKATQSQLKDVNKLLKLDPSNTELLSQKQKTLKDAIHATKEKLDALKTAQEQAKQQLEEGTLGQDKYDALQREIVETEQELKRLQQEAINANAALEKIDQVGQKMEAVGDSISGAGKKLMPLTLAIGGVGAAAIKTTADFDEGMSKVAAISGATGKDLDNLRSKAREMGAKTKFSATEAASAFEYMAMAGWKTEDMLDGIEGIMNLAAASGEDLATTSDIVTDALTAFGLSAKDSGHFADVLAAASSNANTNVSMLGESFKYAAPVAGALGISAEDTSIALGLMANAGIKASQSGTALRTGLTNLAKPTKQMQGYMDKYNIALVENDDGSINLRETMISLREKMGNLSESEQAAAASAIFGKNSMAGWLAIINSSDEDFNKLTGAIDNCDGTSAKMAETMQDNLAGQITILKSQLQELAISFGEILMPKIREIVSKIQAFVDKLNGMSDAQKETIIKVLALVAALGPLLIIIGKTISTVGVAMQGFSKLGKGVLKLSTSVQNAGGVMGVLSKAIGFLTSPIGIVIGVIAVLTAAFVHLWKTNEEFRNKVIAIWNQIKAIFSGFVDGIKERLGALGIDFKSITETIKKVWDGFCELLAPVFIGAFEIISAALKAVLDVITGILDVFIGIFTGNWDQAWTGVKEVFSGIWEGIKGILTAAVNMLKGIADVFLGWFGTNWESVWNSVKSFFTGLWNGIVSFFTGIWTSIKSIVITVLSAIKTAITTAWNAIKTTITTVVNAIKTVVTTVWNAIKTTLSSILIAIKTAVSTAWNAIKTTVTTIVNAVKTTITTVWNAIKSTVTTVLNGIKSTVSTVWNSIKTTITTVMNGIKSTITSIWNGIKSSVSSIVNGVKSTVSSAFNSIKSTATSVWNSIKSAITTPIENAKNAVRNAINTMKGFFNFSWSLPHIKLPHFGISGSFSLNPPSIPHFSVSWYKKAMDGGMILDSPTIFGMKGSHLLGAGEAGSETVVGTRSLMEMIQRAVTVNDAPLIQVIDTWGSRFMDLFLTYFPQFANMQVVMDSGVLVGEIAPSMDSKMGRLIELRGRNN